jgi:gamma-carbonic anhydrase
MSWVLYRVGFWIRETGQALDKVGCFLQGNASYAEEGELTCTITRVTDRRAHRASPFIITSHVLRAVVRHRTLFNLFNRRPAIDGQAFVAPSASLVGDVSVGQGSSVWYGSVLRGGFSILLA